MVEVPRNSRIDAAAGTDVEIGPEGSGPMSQKPVELILMRQLASSLAMPVFLVGADGTLAYYNEPAEALLGKRFDETGEMSVREWASAWQPAEKGGTPLPAERLPLAIAVAERRPARGDFWIHGLDGQHRHIEVTALPLLRATDELVGAVAVFWELPS